MLLDLLAPEHTNKTALIVPENEIELTYGQLASQVQSLAETLNDYGLGPGDRIAMALPNGLEVIASFLAAASVGTAAPLNPAYTRDEFKFYLEDTGARALIVPRGGAVEARAAAVETNAAIIDCDLDDQGKIVFSTNEALSNESATGRNNQADIA